MKHFIALSLLTLTFSSFAATKKICVASCTVSVIAGYETVGIVQSEALITSASSDADGAKKLALKCPNEITGDAKEGKVQSLGFMNCVSL